MAYSPNTDFVGLWRANAGGVNKGEMPGLDFVVAALNRAGILRVVTAGAPPTVNQSTTAWFQPANPTFSAEGILYLWNGTSYVPATPELFLGNSGGGGGISSVAVGANCIINGGFRVNQGLYVSGAALAAGSYGHDQWKAGAGGGDYSFSQLKSSTQIVIAAGKSLIQPIEDVNVAGGSYVLSWTGTAQARAGVNTLVPSGAYAASPLLISGQSAGTAMSVEFNSGSLGTVKLELGTTTTPYVMRPFSEELALCKRYYQKSYDYSAGPGIGVSGGQAYLVTGAVSTTGSYIGTRFSVSMRAAPNVTVYDLAGTANRVSRGGNGKASTVGGAGTDGFYAGTADTTSTNDLQYHWIADARL
jgi:hypothetical protein